MSWDEALDDIAARLKAIAARDPQAILPYSYAGTMGLVQGESMAARFFHKLGASLLDRTICSSAGGEALAATYGGKVGMHVEHFAESKLILIWGSNSIARNLHFWTFAQQAKRDGAKLVCIDPRRTETADKCHEHIALLPGTDGALALALMHELIVNDWLDHDYIARHIAGLAGAARARAAMAARARGARSAASRPTRCARLARDYGTTQPAAIRLNYGMQRVRGGGNAVRLIALLPCLVGRLAAPRRRPAAVELGLVPRCATTPRCSGPTCWPARTPRTINMSTIGDDLLREASPAFGPKIEALVVYNSNPVAVAPRVAQGGATASRARTCSPWCSSTSMTDTADHADYVLPATTQLEHLDVHTSLRPHLRAAQRAGDRAAGPGQAEHADLPRAGGAHGLHRPLLRRQRRDAGPRRASKPDRVDFDALRAKGWAKLPLPDAPFADGGFPTPGGKALADAPGLGVPDHVPNYESAALVAGAGAALPAGDDLAAGAQLPQLQLRQRARACATSRASRCWRCTPTTPPRAASPTAQMVRVFNDRGSYRCKAASAPRARPGVVNGLGIWWRKLGAGRHQRQRADAPAADRHRPRAVVLRLPGRGRSGGRVMRCRVAAG